MPVLEAGHTPSLHAGLMADAHLARYHEQGAVAACGAPIVGWLAERLGFDSSAGADADADIKRAKALGVRQARVL